MLPNRGLSNMAKNMTSSNDLLPSDTKSLLSTSSEGVPDNEKGPDGDVHAKEKVASKEDTDASFAEFLDHLLELHPRDIDRIKQHLLSNATPKDAKLVDDDGSASSACSSSSRPSISSIWDQTLLDVSDPNSGSHDDGLAGGASQGNGSNDTSQSAAAAAATGPPASFPPFPPIQAREEKWKQPLLATETLTQSPYKSSTMKLFDLIADSSGSDPGIHANVTDEDPPQPTATDRALALNKLAELGYGPSLSLLDGEARSIIATLPFSQQTWTINQLVSRPESRDYVLKLTTKIAAATATDDDDAADAAAAKKHNQEPQESVPAQGTPSPVLSTPLSLENQDYDYLARSAQFPPNATYPFSNPHGTSHRPGAGNPDGEAARRAWYGNFPIPQGPGHVESVYLQRAGEHAPAPTAPGGAASTPALDGGTKTQPLPNLRDHKNACLRDDPLDTYSNLYGGSNPGHASYQGPFYRNPMPNRAGVTPHYGSQHGLAATATATATTTALPSETREALACVINKAQTAIGRTLDKVADLVEELQHLKTDLILMGLSMQVT